MSRGYSNDPRRLVRLRRLQRGPVRPPEPVPGRRKSSVPPPKPAPPRPREK